MMRQMVIEEQEEEDVDLDLKWTSSEAAVWKGSLD